MLHWIVGGGRKANHFVNLLDAVACVGLGALCALGGIAQMYAHNAKIEWLPPVLLVGGIVWCLYGIDQTRQWFGAAPMRRFFHVLEAAVSFVLSAVLILAGCAAIYVNFWRMGFLLGGFLIALAVAGLWQARRLLRQDD
jgi:CDP-diglyceride synthetase